MANIHGRGETSSYDSLHRSQPDNHTAYGKMTFSEYSYLSYGRLMILLENCIRQKSHRLVFEHNFLCFGYTLGVQFIAFQLSLDDILDIDENSVIRLEKRSVAFQRFQRELERELTRP